MKLSRNDGGSIEIDANGKDAWQGRLHCVVEALRLSKGVPESLLHIEDYKGALICHWSEEPAGADVATIRKAWNEMCEDGSCNKHNWPGHVEW